MLPLQQAYEVKKSVLAYITATFRFKEKDVDDAFHRLVDGDENGLFKGPFVSLKTPFVKATEADAAQISLEIRPTAFLPHKHQLQAFTRLSARNGQNPEPTLLTTGTGSGKTECFLYPILDYCYEQNRYGKKKGVKVIILYPMNALGSDQAKRLANTIWNDPRLKGVVNAGLFIGEGEDRSIYKDAMGEYNVIEARSAIKDTVPDILLTNFKMLDYGLMQQQYTCLWQGNMDSDSPMLRYIVLDELHTYDGAQGTDVANLIRRLKLKLNLPAGQLCPVGTSATIGNGPESKQQLVDYASDVFGEEFTTDSVIVEHRLPVEDYLPNAYDAHVPSAEKLALCTIDKDNTTHHYIEMARKVWLPSCSANPAEMASRLKELTIVRDLLACTKHIISLEQLIIALAERNVPFRKLANKDVQQKAIETLLALISEARDNGQPMLFLQVQLWQRELSGILRYVQQEPEFTWRDKIDKTDRVALPIYFCRECGASGWISWRGKTDKRYTTDIRKINMGFASHEKELVLLNLYSEKHEPIPDYTTQNGEGWQRVDTVRLNDLCDVPASGSDTIRLQACSRSKGNHFADYCPECVSQAFAMVGGKTATLSSVAISQIMSSDFDSTDIRGRKVLSFTNSVQDAAHQAGFYEARSYRFLLRQSMQQYIKTQHSAITLSQLQEGFKEYWKAQLDNPREYYYRFLPNDLLSKVDLDNNYREGDSYTEAFRREFDLRIDWEICAEFGLMSQLGRTLEKTGASASFFQPAMLKDVYTRMRTWMLENHMEALADREEKFICFLNGLLHRMRMRGAVDHPYFELYRNDLKAVNLNWVYNRKHFLNKHFGGSVQFPKLILTHYNNKLANLCDITAVNNRQQNWCSRYFRASFVTADDFGDSYYAEKVNDFYAELFSVLTDLGLTNCCSAGEGNYALNPDAIWIEPHVKHVGCEQCQSRLCVAEHDTVSEGTHCLNYKCNGRYTTLRFFTGKDYYEMVYNRDKSPRIHASEHTGLLARDAREKLEKDFKEQPSFNSVNALVATSTLEMGIDIGDLNVVGCSDIPPKPSNFLQRIGRAGRKTGSALVLNYAHANKAHDMFYFAEPMEMMEGEVQTPGCFLEAKDILRRHFLAYCIDSWTSDDVSNVFPNLIMNLGLNDNVFGEATFIINRLFLFINANVDKLTSRFAEQYPDKAAKAMDNLIRLVEDGRLEESVKQEFVRLNERIKEINDRRNHLFGQKSALKDGDPRKEELERDIKSLYKERKELENESVIEYMTNVGLLPNYAFPETGVKLEAIVYKGKAEQDSTDKEVEPDQFELVRPASAGLKELAPYNSFYTQRYKLAISGLNTFDWNDALGTFRYCADCDAIAKEGDSAYYQALCPKCASPSWGSCTHKYLRFTGARSDVRRSDSLLGDKSDEREQEQYQIIRHYNFDMHGVHKSFGLKNVGFGIEFCPEMELLEANYGHQMSAQPQRSVNGIDRIPSQGFITCKYCGHVVPLKNEDVSDAKKCHYGYCKHKDVAYAGANDEELSFFENVYLYRKTNTEAIKVLLPVHMFDTDATVELFKSGLELGMRYYYQSSPDHIRIDTYKEKNLATGQFDQYLIIFDTIPGGTGYLSKLHNPEEFSKLLTIAYEHIRDCRCQLEPGKDGCYHCILTYRNQYRRDKLSRQKAEELFAKLVNELGNWETYNTTLGTLTTSGVIEESELEQRFSHAIREYVDHHAEWSWERINDDSSYYYALHYSKGLTEISYNVHLQYHMGTAMGVALPTRPDFQIICTKAVIDGVELDIHQLNQWSIYMDGYQYHASEEHNGFYNDFARREAIRNNGHHRPLFTWTLTWQDMDLNDNAGSIDDLAEELRNAQMQTNDFGLLSNGFLRLMYLLEHPEPNEQLQSVYDMICTLLNTFDIESGAQFARTTFLMPSALTSGSVKINMEADEENLIEGVVYSFKLTEGLSSIPEDDWNKFWRRYNILQFFPEEQTDAVTPVLTPSVSVDDIIDNFDPSLRGVLEQLLANGVEFDHDGGFSPDGLADMEAILGFADKKIVLLPMEGCEQAFINAGYTIVAPEEFNINMVK